MKQRRRRRAGKPRYRDLADYIEQTGDTQTNIAVRVGTSQATVSKVIRSLVMPQPLLALRLSEYANIPLDSFTRNHIAKRIQGAA